MMANYTPLDVPSLEKHFQTKPLSSVLFTTVAVLTMIVLGLIAYILFKQITA